MIVFFTKNALRFYLYFLSNFEIAMVKKLEIARRQK